jgi:telomere length regulation protein
MEDLLTPMSTAYKNIKEDQEDALVEAQVRREAPQRHEFQATSPEEALKILQNEPDFSNLISILKYLDTTSAISLSSPSPLSSQLINVLVSDIVTNYWAILSEKAGGSKLFKYKRERDLLLGSLRNVTGLGAIAARLNALIDQSKATTKKGGGLNFMQALRDCQGVLEAVLHGDTVVEGLWRKLQVNPISKQAALWREVTVLIGGSKLLNSAAEAHSIIKENSNAVRECAWVADGLRYNSWIASNIQYWARRLTLESDRPWKHLTELLSKSLRLGYPGKKART